MKSRKKVAFCINFVFSWSQRTSYNELELIFRHLQRCKCNWEHCRNHNSDEKVLGDVQFMFPHIEYTLCIHIAHVGKHDTSRLAWTLVSFRKSNLWNPQLFNFGDHELQVLGLGGSRQLPSGYFSLNLLTMSGSFSLTPSTWLPRVILKI